MDRLTTATTVLTLTNARRYLLDDPEPDLARDGGGGEPERHRFGA